MKVYLIKASNNSTYSEYKKMTGGPPQNIFSTAACTPEGVEIEMADETIGIKAKLDSTADIVAIFMSTPDAIRAYHLADEFRRRGKTVILGGLHTRFMQEEALEHADSIMVGEVEGTWEQLLDDWKNDRLKKRYQRDTPLDLSELKPYPTDIIHPKKYNWTWSIVVSRGCLNRCEFCLVPRFFKDYTHRPVENIVAELKTLKKIGVEWVELHADNLTANREYALELFKALKPLNMKFYGETTIMIGNDDEMLKAASEAGMKLMLFGLETPSKTALKSVGKEFVNPDVTKQYVRKIQSYGIKASSDFLFGFEEHDTGIFQETIDFIRDVKLDEVYPHLVIPFPGSETFRKLDEEGRILTKDWSKYDGAQVVFKPKLMTAKELEDGIKWVWNQYYGKIATALYGEPSEGKKSKYKWKTMFGLLLLIPAIWFDLSWVWGTLYLFWAINDLQMESTYFIEELTLHENPILYHIVSKFWIGLSLLYFIEYLY